jgi:hypothetical protein
VVPAPRQDAVVAVKLDSAPRTIIEVNATQRRWQGFPNLEKSPPSSARVLSPVVAIVIAQPAKYEPVVGNKGLCCSRFGFSVVMQSRCLLGYAQVL